MQVRKQKLPWWLSCQRIRLQCRRPGSDPWVRKIPWRREWLPTPGFLPGESHGQRSLEGSEEAVPGPSVFPSGEPGVSGDFWGSQEGCQGPFRPSGRLFQNFPQFIVIHRVKGFGIVNKAEIDEGIGLYDCGGCQVASLKSVGQASRLETQAGFLCCSLEERILFPPGNLRFCF